MNNPVTIKTESYSPIKVEVTDMPSGITWALCFFVAILIAGKSVAQHSIDYYCQRTEQCVAGTENKGLIDEWLYED